jgi:predicted site-specific integrase-resolvase
MVEGAMRRPPPPMIARTGGAYRLSTAFKILDISSSHGYRMIKTGLLKVVRISDGSPRIPDSEIARLLGE